MSGNSFFYLLVGDPFLVEEKRKSIADVIRKKTDGSVSETGWNLEEKSLHDVLSDARTLPFLSAAQIFRLVRAERLKKNDLEVLEKYFQSASPYTYLLFEAESLERDAPLAKLIASAGEVYFAQDEDRRSVSSRLIKEKLKLHGKSMAPDALRRLVDQVGDAPALLDSILEQLMTYGGEAKTIDRTAVEKFEENWQDLNVFKLTGAWLAKDTAKALSLMNLLLGSGEKEITDLIGIFHWQLRRYWKGRLLLERGTSQEAILKECKVSVKQAPYFLREIGALSLVKLEEAIEQLFQLDWESKTGQTDPAVGLESWLIRTTA